MKRSIAWTACLLTSLCLMLNNRVGAQALGDNDLLVAVGDLVAGDGVSPDIILEYTRSGSLVRTFHVPPTNDSAGYVRHITVDGKGNIMAFNGTFSPELCLCSPRSSAWSVLLTYPGWSTVNVLDYGGVGAAGRFVFVTDMETAYGGAPNGLIRYDTTTNTAVRFASGTDYINLTIGYDGLLYGLAYGNGSSSPVHLFHPGTLKEIRQVYLPLDTWFDGEQQSIAVAKNGDIFAMGEGGTVFHFNSKGTLLNSAYLGSRHSLGLALSHDGALAVVWENGYVTVTDTSLQTFNTWQAYSAPNQLSWSMDVSFVSTPSHPK